MAKKFPIFPKTPSVSAGVATNTAKKTTCNAATVANASNTLSNWTAATGIKKGDWSNLLSEEQQIELGLKEAPKPAKPHIKLPLKNKTA